MDEPTRSARAGTTLRRALLTTAAWTAPMAVVATAAPALAASVACEMSFPPPSSGNGWSPQTTPGNILSGTSGSWQFTNGGYIVTRDPNQAYDGAITVEVTSPPISFQAGFEYLFTFDYELFEEGPRSMTFDLLVDGEVVPGSHLDTADAPGTGSVEALYTATSTGEKTVSLLFTFESGTEETASDGIRVSGLTAECAA
ncbi:hypothetical protein [Brachybacterium sp. YJGR34]|uniref:hypothetical protein n=1 Tax=Brachybacterium sp. YJGR34 TaxID=2059911 RepID=UPI0013009E89|nr:hypothetical protein [Brachybacterium sp. YJGR34]